MIEIEGDFGKRFVEVSGGTGKIPDIDKALQKIDSIDNNNKTLSQIFNAKTIAGKNHLLHASKLALDAIAEKESFADSEKIELTCWTAGLRQINKALDLVGVKKDTEEIAILTIGRKSKKVDQTQESLFNDLNIVRNEEVLKINEKKEKELSEIFSISKNLLDIYPIQDIILEKIALLSLET